jgi:hypothetical protein
MKFALAVLGLVLAGLTPAPAAEAPQVLSLGVTADGARTTQLPAYDPDRPIAVCVSLSELDTRRVDAVSVVAASPGGTISRIALARDGVGRFAGSLKLAEPGTWSLRLTSRAGAGTSETMPISVKVAAPPPSYAGWVGFGVGSAIFVFAGGPGFILLRRAAREEPEELERAA